MTTKDQTRREAYWPEIEQFFGNLPPELFRQGLLLKNGLTVRYAESGQLKDILQREHDYPLLSFHFWLLDDLGVPQGQARAQLEKHLLLAMFFSLAAIHTHESILDRDTFFDNHFLFLEQTLSQQATRHFAHLFPEDSSPFWEYHKACWDDYAEAHLWEWDAHIRKLTSDRLDEPRRNAAKLAPAKLSVAAVALHSGQNALLPPLLTMMDHLNQVFQVRREILSVRRDLARGVATYPILRTLGAAGIPWQTPVTPERVLGAMLLSGSVKEICQESLDDLESCREIASDLNLPTWLAYFDTLESITRELLGLFSLSTPGRAASDHKHTTFLPPQDSLAQAVKMAEGYLRSDLTFRESWEVQRYVLLNMPEVTCKAFPAGLIIELLSANGHDLAPQVAEVFGWLHQDEFRYYDEYDIPPDADDLGLLLRLYPYSDQKGRHQELLQQPLRWMESNVLPSGEIPVYFTHDVDVPIAPGNAWATHCIAVEINLLLGLIEYDWGRYQGLVEKSALNLFERLLKKGLGLTGNYDLLYTMWVASNLIGQLSSRPIHADLRARIKQVDTILRDRLAREARRRFTSPQDAAFLSLVCLGCPAPPLFRPEWITILLKNQRYDGAWEAEPLYPTPNRGGVPTWYSSRSMTTAFCYHALQTYQRHQPGVASKAV